MAKRFSELDEILVMDPDDIVAIRRDSDGKSYRIKKSNMGVGVATGNVTASANIADTAVVVGDGGVKNVKETGVLIDASDNVALPASASLDVIESPAAPATVAGRARFYSKDVGGVSTPFAMKGDGTESNLTLAAAAGDVTSAANIADNVVARGDGGAKGIQASGVSIDDTDNLTVPGDIITPGTVDGRDVSVDGTALDAVVATEGAAIHDNVAGEIVAITEKGTPVGGDWLLIEDSADSNNKKRIQVTNLPVIAGATENLEIDAQKASAGTLAIGDAIYVTSWDNGAGVVECELADASTGGTMPSIGIVKAAMTNSVTGQVILSGLISGVDTSAFTVGNALYTSETAGELTETRPNGTAMVQKVGICIRVHASLGVILIVGAGRSNDLPNLSTGQVWMGDGSGVPQGTLVSALTAATATAAGVIELATQAEVDAGTDTSRAITPATLTGKPLAGMELTDGQILQGNASNNAIEVGAGAADADFRSPWTLSFASDPDETNTGIAAGFQWVNTANGKMWVCLASGVWRCTNVVVETNMSTVAVEADNTWDGSIKVFTGASAGLNVEMPASLNNGLSFECVQWNANDPITVILKAASGVTINTHSDFVPTTNGQFSSIVVTVIDSNDVLVRAGGAKPA